MKTKRSQAFLRFFRTHVAVGLLSWTAIAFAETNPSSTALPSIVIEAPAQEKSSVKKYEIQKVEVLDQEKLQNKKASTFAELVDNEKGLDTQTACAFCGSKRISINGFKGEHTTILIDGLPLHSTASSFYGVEAIPLEQIESIDIYRGAGTALWIPEAIGGAIDIRTKDPRSTSTLLRSQISDLGDHRLSLMKATELSTTSALLGGAEVGQSLPLDLDHNRISEKPAQKTHGLYIKSLHSWSETTDFTFRGSWGSLNTIGGSMKETRLNAVAPLSAAPTDFDNYDVRNPFRGDIRSITDNIEVNRLELSGQSETRFSDQHLFKTAIATALQKQQAYFSHGYDFDTDDRLSYLMAESQLAKGSDQLLTIGLSGKFHAMDTSSAKLYQDQGLKQDDLINSNWGLHSQWTYLLNDKTEFAIAARFDEVHLKWKDFNKSINEQVLAPRLFLKHQHSDEWTSRASYGLGTRTPLSLFESQHGTNHYGFDVELSKIEKAHSFVYSLLNTTSSRALEMNWHWTRLENMAYGEDRADIDASTIFKNADEIYEISVVDLSWAEALSPRWTVEGLLEILSYPKKYKEKLPVAAVERRFTLSSKYHWKEWELSQNIQFVGERNLADYGYAAHYNRAYKDEDVASPTFDELFLWDQKRQRSPLFYTVDLAASRSWGPHWQVSLSATNIFDYTQTRAGDSPTTWDVHGDHVHLDNFHIWGPLEGRRWSISLKGNFD